VPRPRWPSGSSSRGPNGQTPSRQPTGVDASQVGASAGARLCRPCRRRERPSGAALIFTTGYGTPIEPRNFNRSFDRCITAARVPRITVHGTRKTCATLLAALEVHPRVAMRILRHSKINVTMEIYTEVPSEATVEALRKLSEQLTA
jgi:integrase